MTDPVLIKNTRSVHRRPLCDFSIKTCPRIKKNSNIYKMLKFGPLPDGDFLYLLKDGKLTKYARWLLMAADLDLRFLDLCLLVKIMNMYVAFRNAKMIKYVLREWLFAQFCIDYNYKTVRNSLTKLLDKGYIRVTPLRSVSSTDDQVKIIQDIMGGDFKILHDYIEEIMSEDLFALAY